MEEGLVLDGEAPCMALVPVNPAVQWSRAPGPALPGPNSTFVTQLIATAEWAPQTRLLWRATPADALTAYRAAQHRTSGAGIRPRQTI